jgi:hypothetical protein
MFLVHGLPYKRLPKVIMRSGVENSNQALNQFPVTGGVSKTMSPLTIMTGKQLPDYNDMTIEFEAYAQVYVSNNSSNTLKARTTGAIALAPMGNAQGGYSYFMSLVTGNNLSRQQWDELPMPEGVIAAVVEDMAEAGNQPIIGPGGPLFKWARGVPIEDDIEVPILQDENKVKIVDVITTEDADEGADDDFNNDKITPESSGEEEEEEEAEEVDVEHNEQEAEEHVADEHGCHGQNKDYELDVIHDE